MGIKANHTADNSRVVPITPRPLRRNEAIIKPIIPPDSSGIQGMERCMLAKPQVDSKTNTKATNFMRMSG